VVNGHLLLVWRPLEGQHLQQEQQSSRPLAVACD
jgi:hypothetical protein